MARPKGREPRIEIRRHTTKDGVVREYPAVRYYDARGVYRRKGFKTVAEAELERARLALEGPGPAAIGRSTIGEFWPSWIEDARSRLEKVTVEMHEYYWAREIEPRWGHVAFADVTPRAVAQWRGLLVESGMGVESVRKSMVLLQAIFRVAIEWGEARENPVQVVRKPRKNQRKAIKVVEPPAVERLRAAMLDADDHLAATLVTVLAYTGMRPAEVLALERRHIRTETILVEQAVSSGCLKVQKTGRVYRTVDLLDPLVEDLHEWIDRRAITGEADALFPRSDGGWWTKDDWDNWRNRHFHPLTRAAGLGRLRPYDLRHSFVSLLIREKRASIVDIADQLGHSPSMALDTYAHVVRENRRTEPIDATAAIYEARRTVAKAGTAVEIPRRKEG